MVTITNLRDNLSRNIIDSSSSILKLELCVSKLYGLAPDEVIGSMWMKFLVPCYAESQIG